MSSSFLPIGLVMRPVCLLVESDTGEREMGTATWRRSVWRHIENGLDVGHPGRFPSHAGRFIAGLVVIMYQLFFGTLKKIVS
jgi:hypothetical protein